MAILVATGTTQEVAAATSTAVPYPATVAANKIAVVWMVVNSATLITSLGAPWTDVERRSRLGSTAIPSIYLAWKVTTGAEGGTSVTVTHPNAVSISQIEIWDGVDLTTPLDVSPGENDNTAASAATAPTITPVTPGAALVHFSGNNANTVTSTPPSSPATFTEIMDGTGTRSGAVSYLLNQPAAATGAVTATWSAGGAGQAYLIALRPALAIIPPMRQAASARRLMAALRTRRIASFTPPTVVAAAPPPPVPTVRHRVNLAALSRRRGQSGHVPAASSAATHQLPRRRLNVKPVQRRPQPAPVPAQVNPPYTALANIRHRINVARIAQRRTPTPVPTQVTFTNPALPVPAIRHRVWLGKVTRGRQIAPVPAQVVVVAASVPVQMQRRLRLPVIPRRHQEPAHVSGAPATPERSPLRHRIPFVWRLRHAQPAHVPASAPGLRTEQRRRTRFTILARHRAATVVPTVVVAPSFVTAPGRKPRRLVTPKRRTVQRVLTAASTVVVTPGSMSTAPGPVAVMSTAPTGAGMTTAPGPVAGMGTGPTSSGMTSAPGPSATMRGA